MSTQAHRRRGDGPSKQVRLPAVCPHPAITDAGLVLGAGTRLARTERGRLVPEERDRALALLAVAAGRPVGAEALAPVEKAADDWRRGDRALANIRLALAGLPRLGSDEAAEELALGARMLDSGVAPSALLDALAASVPSFRAAGLPGRDVAKGYVNQPRVPAGNGRDSGRWTAFWDAVRDYLNVEVPEYDIDTGEEVGTQTRGHRLATNPLVVGAVGTVVFLGGEAAIIAAEVPAAVNVATTTLMEAGRLLPGDMTVAEFGRLAGFAKGLQGAAQASTRASAEALQGLRAAGVSKLAITFIRRAYAQEARRTPQNLSAFHRTRLLRDIERRY